MNEKVEVRKSNGQFGPGNKTGGRKRKQVEDEGLALFERAVSEKDKLDIIRIGITKAKKGDIKWAQWLFNYLIGPPVERKEITGADNQPLVIRVVYDEERIED